MQHRVLRGLVLMVLIVMTASCQSTGGGEDMATISPLESPLVQRSVLPSPPPVPEPSADKGVVVGKLVADDPLTLIGQMLYLGNIINADEQTHMGFLDRSKDPVAQMDIASGQFFFADIEAGDYSLIIYEVESTGRVYLDASGDVHLVRVEAGEVTDLGEINLGQ